MWALVQVQPTKAYQASVELLNLARQLTASGSKVFVTLDLEWDEKNISNILEIGMATLDLRKGRQPPTEFPPSIQSIRGRHHIISENLEIENHFVRSIKFGFEFGSLVSRLT